MLRVASWAGAALAFVLLGATLLMSPSGFGRQEPVKRFVGKDATPSQRFDGDQSMRYLEAICALGPRLTASDAMREQQRLIVDHFETLGAQVERQNFTVRQPSLGNQTVTGTNIVVRWPNPQERRVLLGVHYDTRPHADQEPVLRNRGGVFLGANDGASGVAFLLELGRRMPNLAPSVGVDFVFFDAEEYIFEPSKDRYFLGSEHFVQEYRSNEGAFRYDAVLVLDMIGDKELTICPDERSATRCGPLVREVWSIARELGVKAFQPEVRHEILDDHISFQNAGIPAIALIDFDYAHWHRLTDTPDKCSADSLGAVAKVVEAWLARRR